MATAGLTLYVAASMFFYMYPMLEFRHVYNGEKRLAEFVKALTEPDAVIIAQDQVTFIAYYGHRKTIFLPMENPTQDRTKDFVDQVALLLRRGIPVYYTECAYLPSYEAASLRIMTDRFTVRKVGEVLSEDYHRPEIRFRLHVQKLYRVVALKAGE
jgi:hypothetical protein